MRLPQVCLTTWKQERRQARSTWRFMYSGPTRNIGSQRFQYEKMSTTYSAAARGSFLSAESMSGKPALGLCPAASLWLSSCADMLRRFGPACC